MPPRNLTGTEIRRSLRSEANASNPSRNWASLSIGVARVKDVLYDELKCTLVVISGEEDYYEYPGVDITAAAAGRRHFVGALPEPGDLCYVGWSVRESSGSASAKSPVILGWIPAAPWMGREWIPFSPMEPGEGLTTPRDRTVASGILDRVRFKMRHLGPGDVFLSSSLGSDIVLNDGVTIANRRGNELRLRDADQALVVRALSEFHALGGARSYSGAVAREARLLSTILFSDGIFWDAPRQVTPGTTNVRNPDELGESPYPRDFLTPGLIFRRSPGTTQSNFESSRETTIAERLDPFDFLRWGAFVDDSGYATDPTATRPSIVYGGKTLYRVGLSPDGTPENASGDPLHSDTPPPDALTEHRVELRHTTDGTLPVTEQTDGFDADQLPSGLGTGTPPFIEWVLGSVIGNDPFSVEGRTLYGFPLRVEMGEPGGRPTVGTALGYNLKEHAATLFRIRPPIGDGESSFTSFTKDGRFRAYLAGTEPDSASVTTKGDLNLTVGGRLNLRLAGGISLNGAGVGPGNVGLALGSPTGAVVIRGGGALDTGSGAREAADASRTASPSVVIEGDSGVTIHGGRTVSISAPETEIANASSIRIAATTSLSLGSGARATLTTGVYDVVVSDAETRQYGGPRGGNPANGPSRRTTFSSTPATGSTGGVTDQYTMVFGDRLEEFQLRGNSTTRVLTIGDLTYETNGGSIVHRAGANRTEISATSGVQTTVGTGNYSVSAPTGTASMTSGGDATIRSVGGTVTVASAAGVTLASSGTVTGGVLCGGDIEPLTGLPYSTFMTPRGVSIRPGG